jgi:hypothetical protein
LIEGNFRKDPHKGESAEGYGLVKIPKEEWKENDAETGTNPEPAIMTQSQRNPDGN